MFYGCSRHELENLIMKKICVLFSACLCGLTAFSQTPILTTENSSIQHSNSTVTAKNSNSTKRNFSVEMQFNPFGNNFNSFDLKNGKLKGSLYLSNKMAVRLGFGLGVNKNTNRPDVSIPQRDDYDSYSEYNYAKDVYDISSKDFTETKNTDFSFSIGLERHFKSTEYLDLYYGAEFEFGLTKAKTYSESNYYNTRYDNSYSPHIDYKYCNTSSSNSTDTYLNCAAFTGANVYIYKSLYIGAELGLKLGNTKKGNKVSDWSTTNVDAKDKNSSSESDVLDKSFFIKAYCDPFIHIGWTF